MDDTENYLGYLAGKPRRRARWTSSPPPHAGRRGYEEAMRALQEFGTSAISVDAL
jgi:hypothetical protein